MLTTILVPLDGSTLAERALPYAESLARSAGARMLLLRAIQAHAFPGTDPADEQLKAVEAAESYLQRVASGLQTGTAIETIAFYGDPVEAIVLEAALREASLIVMSTHGRSGLGQLLYGSVARAVLQRSSAPVLLVGRRTTTAPTLAERPHLVVPLDGTTFSESALPVAETLARALGGELMLVHCVPVPQRARAAEDGRVIAYVDQELANLKVEAEAYLVEIAEQVARRFGRRPQTLVAVGTPAEAIAQVAREQPAGLVIMATHARTGLGRLLLGSVADGVLQQGVPLIVTRPAALSKAA